MLAEPGRNRCTGIATPGWLLAASVPWEYPRVQVVNHYLAENGKLTQKPMRGLVLAIGSRMPFSLRHGSLLEASLVLHDHDVEDIAHRYAITF
jgi:hypothetical protein